MGDTKKVICPICGKSLNLTVANATTIVFDLPSIREGKGILIRVDCDNCRRRIKMRISAE